MTDDFRVRAKAASTFLDEAGSVYIPLPSPDRRVVKLNQSASRMWRALLAEGLSSTDWEEPESHELVLDLYRRGIVADLSFEGAEQ